MVSQSNETDFYFRATNYCKYDDTESFHELNASFESTMCDCMITPYVFNALITNTELYCLLPYSLGQARTLSVFVLSIWC